MRTYYHYTYSHNIIRTHQHYYIQYKQKYISCLKEQKDKHHLCRELSKDYLQCRMNNDLMAAENLDQLGYSEEAKVEKSVEYDKAKEKEGYIAGKHIDGRMKWWFQSK